MFYYYCEKYLSMIYIDIFFGREKESFKGCISFKEKWYNE